MNNPEAMNTQPITNLSENIAKFGTEKGKSNGPENEIFEKHENVVAPEAFGSVLKDAESVVSTARVLDGLVSAVAKPLEVEKLAPVGMGGSIAVAPTAVISAAIESALVQSALDQTLCKEPNALWVVAPILTQMVVTLVNLTQYQTHTMHYIDFTDIFRTTHQLEKYLKRGLFANSSWNEFKITVGVKLPPRGFRRVS